MEGVGKEADVLELLRVRILHGSVGGPGVNRVTQGVGWKLCIPCPHLYVPIIF